MNQDDAEQIHETSLRIVEQIGVRLEHDEVVERLLKAGARAGQRPQEVRIPASMVREYLSLAPPTIDSSGDSVGPISRNFDLVRFVIGRRFGPIRHFGLEFFKCGYVGSFSHEDAIDP